MEENILCERESRDVLSEFYEDLIFLIQDSDAVQEKQQIKEALKNMTTTTSYLILGEDSVGKTSLLQALFQDIVKIPTDMAGEICEYRWGETEAETPLLSGYQKKFIPSENLRGLSIIDTKGVNSFSKERIKKVRELVDSVNAIFVVFDAKKINSSRIWDIIENYPKKKILFFLTKCDLVSEKELHDNTEKLKCYMKESHISAPIFPVSMKEDGNINDTVTLVYVREYIQEYLIGKNPVLKKQYENIAEMKKMLMQLKNSFELRKKQYFVDVEVLHKINASMDIYVANHKEILDGFLKKLILDVSKDIDQYQDEIISKVDPYKIKERFQSKNDFVNYLNMVNDNYKNMMNDSVNRKTMEAMKQCLHDLEIVYQEAVGYFEKRESILELNDRFYGSMSKSRKQMVAETKENIVASSQFYKTLSDASETLFMQIWNEREKYDKKIKTRKTLSCGMGGGGGAGAALSIIAAAGTTGTAATGAVATTGTVVTSAATAGATTAATAGATTAATAGATFGLFPVMLVVVGAIVGAVVINKIAKTLYDPKAAGAMEDATKKCIAEFKQEVSQTKEAMISKITEQITTLFERELFSVDSCFVEFRMSVNIDEKKLPDLEKKLNETLLLIDKIEKIEV